MESNKRNVVNEPSEIYETVPKETISEDLHPVLVKLLEKAIQESKDGKVIPHEEAMKKIKEKIASLK